MAEMKSTTCRHHRPPQMIFCENNGNGDEDDHEDDISNSLATVDDLDLRPNNAVDEHNIDHDVDDDDDDNHDHRNTNPSSQRKGDVKRADEEEDEEDDNVKQSHTNYDCDNIPGSTATPTLSSDLIDDGANALTEQLMSSSIDAPAMITSMSTTTTTGEAAAAAATKDGMAPPETSSEAVTRLETLDDDYLGVMERNELPVLHVGRVIGKGGEMIRDLQARSGCRIDVDQNVMDPNAPRYITYHGQSQDDIDFAKLLVSMVCQNNILDDEEHQHHHHHPIELPLGKAVRRYIQVHKSVVGRIIGRGGDMIRDLQIKSHARIQVDHKGEYAGGMGGGGGGDGEEKDYPTSTTTSANEQQFRQVMITGTEESVQRAEEMIMELSNRHQVEFEIQQQQEHDQQLHGSSSSDFTFVSAGMEPYWDRRLYGARVGPPPKFGSIAGYGGAYGPPPMQERSFPVPTWNTNRYLSNSLLLPTTSTMIETEIIPCARENIGHVIGRRGITVNDLQWRSGCNIQIDRKGCKINISGSRHGIELAKNMIYNIFEHGPTHMYAGGRQPQFDEQEPSVPHRELVQPMPAQAAANQYPYPGESLQNPSHPPTFVYNRPMIPHQQEFYPRQAQPMMMYGQLPQRQVFPHQQILQPPIQDTSPTAQSVAAASSLSSASVWRAATTIDGRIYYYNINTMETRWDNPEG